MSQYYLLLKNNLIDFEKLLLEKYSFLGLDEIDAIILIKMNKLLNAGRKFSTEAIVKTMSITEETLKNKLVSLINNQFITLMLDGKSEIYSLDDTFKRLTKLLEENETIINSENDNNEMQKVVTLLETEFKKVLSPLDLEIVHNWIYEDKFPYEKIYNAVMETLKLKKKTIQYVDVILNKKEEIKKEPSKEGLQNLFNQVYGKIK